MLKFIDGALEYRGSALVIGTSLAMTEDANGVPRLDSTAGGGATDLDGLSDVTITAGAAGEVLRHNGSGQWVDTTLGMNDLTSSTLDDLSDAAITGVAVGHLLKWDGSNWVNSLGAPGPTPIPSGGPSATFTATGPVARSTSGPNWSSGANTSISILSWFKRTGQDITTNENLILGDRNAVFGFRWDRINDWYEVYHRDNANPDAVYRITGLTTTQDVWLAIFVSWDRSNVSNTPVIKVLDPSVSISAFTPVTITEEQAITNDFFPHGFVGSAIGGDPNTAAQFVGQIYGPTIWVGTIVTESEAFAQLSQATPISSPAPDAHYATNNDWLDSTSNNFDCDLATIPTAFANDGPPGTLSPVVGGVGPHTHVEADITDLQSYLLDITGEPLSDLTDVTLTTIASGELLKWTGAAWINNTLAEAGISAVGHTHVEADITDLGPYVLAAGGTFSGTVFSSTDIGFRIQATAPEFVIEETDASTDEGLWGWRSQGGIMSFRAINDAFSAGVNFINVRRTGTVVDAIDLLATNIRLRDGSTLRIYDSGNTDWGEWSHDGTDFNLDFTNTSLYKMNLTVGLVLSSVITDATSKNARFGGGHYLNAEEPVMAFIMSSGSTGNFMGIGGGSAAYNAATHLSFYTAPTTTTLVGVGRAQIPSTGGLYVGAGNVGTGKPHNDGITTDSYIETYKEFIGPAQSWNGIQAHNSLLAPFQNELSYFVERSHALNTTVTGGASFSNSGADNTDGSPKNVTYTTAQHNGVVGAGRWTTVLMGGTSGTVQWEFIPTAAFDVLSDRQWAFYVAMRTTVVAQHPDEILVEVRRADNTTWVTVVNDTTPTFTSGMWMTQVAGVGNPYVNDPTGFAENPTGVRYTLTYNTNVSTTKYIAWLGMAHHNRPAGADYLWANLHEPQTFTQDQTLGSLGTFDSATAPAAGESLVFDGGVNKWQPKAIQIGLSNADVGAANVGDGTSVLFADDSRTLSGSPTTASGLTPVITPIYQGNVIDCSSLTLGANELYVVEYHSGGGFPGTELIPTGRGSNAAKIVHGRLSSATTYTYRFFTRAATDGLVSNTATGQPLATPDVLTSGVAFISQLAVDSLAALSSVLGSVTATSILVDVGGTITNKGDLANLGSAYFRNLQADALANTYGEEAVESIRILGGALSFRGLQSEIFGSSTITGNTIANPTVVTTSAGHSLTNGDRVFISGSNSTPLIDGFFVVSGVTSTTFTVPVNVSAAGTSGTVTESDRTDRMLIGNYGVNRGGSQSVATDSSWATNNPSITTASINTYVNATTVPLNDVSITNQPSNDNKYRVKFNITVDNNITSSLNFVDSTGRVTVEWRENISAGWRIWGTQSLVVDVANGTPISQDYTITIDTTGITVTALDVKLTYAGTVHAQKVLSGTITVSSDGTAGEWVSFNYDTGGTSFQRRGTKYFQDNSEPYVYMEPMTTYPTGANSAAGEIWFNGDSGTLEYSNDKRAITAGRAGRHMAVVSDGTGTFAGLVGVGCAPAQQTTGTGTSVSNVPTDEGLLTRLRSGTTIGSSNGVIWPGIPNLRSKRPITFTAVVRTDATNINNCRFWIGIGSLNQINPSNNTAVPTGHFCGFGYHGATWRFQTRDGTNDTNTNTVLTVAADTTYYLRFTLTESSCTWSVNTATATTTATLPSSTQTLGATAGIISTSTTTRFLIISYLSVESGY